MAQDDRSGNGKSFADMMREASEGVGVGDPNSPPSRDRLIELSDAVLATFEDVPLSTWQKHCVLASALLRVLTGERDAKTRGNMLLQCLEELGEKITGLALLGAMGSEVPDRSLPGTANGLRAPNVGDVGHA